MKIKQVEELVGITSKNIRFYEDQNLISPTRADNGYREYSQKEVGQLKNIKLLRKLGVSVEEIKNIFEHKLNLEDCLEKRKKSIEGEIDNLHNMTALADALLASNTTIDSIDSDFWLDEVEKMEKEGVDFVDIGKIDIRMKKKIGAITAGIIMMIIAILYAAIILWAGARGGMPLSVAMVVIIIPITIAIAIFVAIRSRVKEINGGEEDEASKY